MKFSIVLFLLSVGCVSAFVTGTHRQKSNAETTTTTNLNLIGPESVGIAMISAAAGAAIRQPEINTLESELAEARVSIEKSKEEMERKVEELEDKLFEIDRAYESQSAKFQEEYEKKKAQEVARITEKLKTDMKFKLDIEMEREKSRLLAEKLKEVNNVEETGEIAKLRLQKQQLEAAKEKLELALNKSEEKLELTKAPATGNSFWPF